MSKNLVFVKGDDWQGFYIDSKLILEDHSLRVEDVLTQLGICASVKYANDEWLWKQGHLPENLEDVVLDE